MSLAATLVGGMVFGLALAAPPGPMNAVIATESVLRGWGAGFRAGLGAMVADVCFFLLALVGLVAFVQRSPDVRTALFVAGGLLMIYFAYGAVASARSFVDEELEEGKGFRKAFVLALTNPFQIVFWLTVGVGLLEPGQLDVLAALPVVGQSLAGRAVVQTGEPAIIVGLFAGVVVWILGFPAALVSARRRVDSVAPVVAWLSAAVLAGSGLLFLAEAASRL
ncbi:LysE family translocator [Halobacteria archaeon HArc-gm2]|nr:LysE family translocator [Halobacteria archaeon HArc-gm2]